MSCRVLAGGLTTASRPAEAQLCRKFDFPPPAVTENFIVTFTDDQIVTFADDPMVVL